MLGGLFALNLEKAYAYVTAEHKSSTTHDCIGYCDLSRVFKRSDYDSN